MAFPAGITPSPTGATETLYAAGIALALQPADPTLPFLVTRATDAAFSLNVVTFTVAAEDVVHWDALPYSAQVYYYRAQHVGQGGEPNSAVTATASGTPQLLTTAVRKRLETLTVEARRRGDTLYGADGQLAGGTTMAEGTNARPLVRNQQQFVVRDGDTIAFSPAYQNNPTWTIEGGISHQPTNAAWSGGYTATAPTYRDATLSDVTTGSAKVRAKLRQKGIRTARALDFSNVTRTAVGDTDVATVGAAGGAVDDAYTVKLTASVAITAEPAPFGGHTSASATLVIAVDVDTGTGYNEVATLPALAVTAVDGATQTRTLTGTTQAFTAASLVTGSGIRLRIKSLTSTGDASGPPSATMHGWVTAVNGAAGVAYVTATDSTASMTPNTDDTVVVTTRESVA